jgi:hypothetical protein
VFIKFYQLTETVLESLINPEYDEAYTKLFYWHRYSREERVKRMVIIVTYVGKYYM